MKKILLLLFIGLGFITKAQPTDSLNIGGTWHYYEFFSNTNTITYDSALVHASNSHWKGMKGYILTVTSHNEDSLVHHWFDSSTLSLLTYNKSYMLAIRKINNKWYWTDGPEKGICFYNTATYNTLGPISGVFHNWAANEPNNTQGIETYAHTFNHTGPVFWNDVNNIFPTAYIIEYSEDYLCPSDSIVSVTNLVKIDSNTTKSILSIDSINSITIDTITNIIDTIQGLGISGNITIDTLNYTNTTGYISDTQIDTLIINSNLSHIITKHCTSEYIQNTSYILKDSTYLNQNIQWTHTRDSISSILDYYLDTTLITTFIKTDSTFIDSLLYNSCLDTTFLISDTITSFFVKNDTNNSLSSPYSSLSYYINGNTTADTLTQSYNKIDTLFTIITLDTIISCTTDTITQDSNPYWFPNVFSPNGDNINDLYEFHTPDQEFEFTIYNRWGNRVWKQTNIDDNWDGYNRGEIAPGVYLYTYSKTTSSGYKGMPFQGTITLLR